MRFPTVGGYEILCSRMLRERRHPCPISFSKIQSFFVLSNPSFRNSWIDAKQNSFCPVQTGPVRGSGHTSDLTGSDNGAVSTWGLLESFRSLLIYRSFLSLLDFCQNLADILHIASNLSTRKLSPMHFACRKLCAIISAVHVAHKTAVPQTL